MDKIWSLKRINIFNTLYLVLTQYLFPDHLIPIGLASIPYCSQTTEALSRAVKPHLWGNKYTMPKGSLAVSVAILAYFVTTITATEWTSGNKNKTLQWVSLTDSG